MLKHGNAHKNGLQSIVLFARLRKRSREYVFEQQHVGELMHHMGGATEVTTPQAELMQMAARLKLLESVAYAECVKHGFISKGQVAPAFESFAKCVRVRSDLLMKLGLERKAREVTVEEFISGTGKRTDEPA